MCNDIVNTIIECIGRTKKKLVKSWHFLGKSDFGKFPCLQNEFVTDNMVLLEKLPVNLISLGYSYMFSGQLSSQIHISLR